MWDRELYFKDSAHGVVKVKVTQSCLILCDPMDYTVHGILQARILEYIAVPFQGIFSTQDSNPGLSYYRWILYQLSHQGSPHAIGGAGKSEVHSTGQQPGCSCKLMLQA